MRSALGNGMVIWLAGLLLVVPCRAHGQNAPVGDVFDQFHRYSEDEHKAFFSAKAGESVDPFTGNLRIVEEDVALRGRGGLDLRVVRTYSSKIWGRADLLDMEPLLAEKEHSVLGYGWSFHFGRLKNPNASGVSGVCSGDFPVYEEADGSAHVFYPVGAGTFVSKDFWLMKTACDALAGAGACIWSPDGVRYDFSSDYDSQFFVGLTPVWPVGRIVDPFDNVITFNYAPQTGMPTSVTDTYGRSITFEYTEGEDGYRLDFMSVNGREYHYLYTTYTPSQTAGTGRQALPGPRRFLVEVQPPAGPAEHYQYGYDLPVAQNQYALAAMTNGTGGTTSYEYESVTFFTGRDFVPFAVVGRRTEAGRGVLPATWSYTYDSPGPGDSPQTTTIARPDGKMDEYTMVGFGYVAGKSTWTERYTYGVGLTLQVSRGDGAEVESLWWDANQIEPVSQATYSAPVYSSNCGAYYVWDDYVYVPVLVRRNLQRDEAVFSMEYSSFDPYGQPQVVLETGQQGALGNHAPKPAIRSTSKTYFYAPLDRSEATLNLVRGKVASQHVCVGSDCLDNSSTYNGPGFAADSRTEGGVVTLFEYFADGNLSQVTNALGQHLSLGSYANGVPRTLDFNGAFTVTRTVSWEGWIRTETDGRQNTTGYDYDEIGRLKTVTPPGNNQVTGYVYAPDGSWVRTTKGSWFRVSQVDGFGRELSTQDSEGTLTSARYDAMGRAWFRSYPYDASMGEVGIKLEYDTLGRVRTETKGYRPAVSACDVVGACRVTKSYLANCESTTEEREGNDSTTTWHCGTSYGDPGERNLTQVGDAVGNIWNYGFDAAGKLVSVTAPLPQGNRSYLYNAKRFLQNETSPERGTIAYGRNDIGQVTSKRDERPVVVTYDYTDPLSRLKTVVYPDARNTVARDYDDANNVTLLNSDAGGRYDFGYDELNRLRTQTWTYAGQVYVATYHYDSAGCLDTVTYPTGTVLTATCDTANRVKTMSVGGSLLVQDVTYHPSGQVASITYANGLTTTFHHDDRARVEEIDVPGVMDLWYGYDGADNVKSLENRALVGTLRTMTYDGLNRLTSVSADGLWGGALYQYDALGNRTYSAVGTSWTRFSYDERNRLSSVQGSSPAFESRQVSWDDASRPATSSEGATYRYDGLDRRVEKSEGAQTTVYHHGPSGEILAETLRDGTKLRDYFYLGGKLIAVDGCITGMPPSCTSERQWYHTDTLGSVIARTDATGTVSARIEYQPWGEEWSENGYPGDRQYNGRVYDPGTGFHDYGARMYWPAIGRFISADSYAGDIANPASLNRYSYVQNNPYKYTDPTGHNVWVAAIDERKAEVNAIIAKIKATPEGAAVFKQLEESEHDHIIYSQVGMKPGAGTEADNALDAMTPGVGSGTYIYFDPTFTPSVPTEGGKQKASPEIVLFHESAHAAEIDKGEYPTKPPKPTDTHPWPDNDKAQQHAIARENIFRKQTEPPQPIRTGE